MQNATSVPPHTFNADVAICFHPSPRARRLMQSPNTTFRYLRQSQVCDRLSGLTENSPLLILLLSS